VWSRILTWLKKKLTPSSKYGLSDFCYGATLIRIPYRKGPIWKWYAYWGSLILQTTSWAPGLFRRSRIVARYWIERPNIWSSQRNAGYVHLGFWSLWASPEGFAGYGAKGGASYENSVMTSLRQALKISQARNTIVYVVGHSLGGAVSRYSPIFPLVVATVLRLIGIPASPH
jgi:pimeloyl-ACP methyl ester carboxylesterase